MEYKNNEISLSIEETNELRRKLGLKPLKEETSPLSTEVGNKSAEKTAEIELRIQQSKEKRILKNRIGQGSLINKTEKPLSASEWIKKANERKSDTIATIELAEKKLGLENNGLIDNTNILTGVKFSHTVDDLKTGEEVILTLKDTSVFNDDPENKFGDELENIYLAENDRIKKRAKLNDLIKQDKMIYSGLDERGEGKILFKYDKEEIIKNESSGNIFNELGMIVASEEDKERDKERNLKNIGEDIVDQNINVIYDTLNADDSVHRPNIPLEIARTGHRPVLPVASTQELDVPQKKIKIRKRKIPSSSKSHLIQNDLDLNDDELEENSDFLRKLAQLKKSEKRLDLNTVIVTDYNAADELEKTIAIARNRAIIQQEEAKEEPVETGKGFIFKSGELDSKSALVFTTASTISNSISINEDTKIHAPIALAIDKEKEWNQNEELFSEQIAKENVRDILRPVDDLRSGGVAAALRAFKSSGATVNISQAMPENMSAQERAKYLEKKEFKLDLTYRDKEGRILNTKEAYKYMSHIFHGKGPGKIKADKIKKRILREEKNVNSSEQFKLSSDFKKAQKKSGEAFVELNKKERKLNST